ncbi:MAG: S-adenosylmethionine decarboxylase [Desulfobacteraceae bacterium]|jgi:S-adenosylmethionine/arginine decarboxylase-like enzyme
MNVSTLKTFEAAEPAPWGILSSIDLYGCNPEKIRDAELIKRFVADLCDLIEMKRFGETVVVHFGEDEKVAGFSMTQLIETSLISAHFANLTNTTYLDVFSCKYYDSQVVADFAKDFFDADEVRMQVLNRQ